MEINNHAKDYGDEEAQDDLGRCYGSGIGVEKDEIKAFELYKMAAEKEYAPAQNSLATLYENGKGTEKDLGKAIHLYNKAAENGGERV